MTHRRNNTILNKHRRRVINKQHATTAAKRYEASGVRCRVAATCRRRADDAPARDDDGDDESRTDSAPRVLVARLFVCLFVCCFVRRSIKCKI